MRVCALSWAALGKTEEAMRLLFHGLEIAGSQGALAFELKLASSLVEIDNSETARNTLRGIVDRIREGRGTRDYREAAAKLGL
jgi:hypothetical protein